MIKRELDSPGYSADMRIYKNQFCIVKVSFVKYLLHLQEQHYFCGYSSYLLQNSSDNDSFLRFITGKRIHFREEFFKIADSAVI